MFQENTQNKVDIWLDDERDPTNPVIQKYFGAKGNEIWVKTVEEAMPYFVENKVNYISFDHDLGIGNKDGIKLAKWIEKQAFQNNIDSIQWHVHSASPVGSMNIKKAMMSADKYWSQNENH